MTTIYKVKGLEFKDKNKALLYESIPQVKKEVEVTYTETCNFIQAKDFELLEALGKINSCKVFYIGTYGKLVYKFAKKVSIKQGKIYSDNYDFPDIHWDEDKQKYILLYKDEDGWYDSNFDEDFPGEIVGISIEEV